MPVKEYGEGLSYRASGFRIAILALIFLLIMIRVIGFLLFPGYQIIPPDTFFAFAIVELFFLWLDSVREKHQVIFMQKKREALNLMKQKFILITSHELRTPMAILQGYLDFFKKQVYADNAEERDHAVEKMTAQVERLSKILHNLAKLSSGKMPYDIKKLEMATMGSVIDGAIDDIKPFLHKRGQTLSLDIRGVIPSVMMDRREIKQVIQNLLLNAIRFTPDGGRIIVRVMDEEDQIRVEVEDNGIGISSENLKHIFESFYEAQDTMRHSSGSIEFKSYGMGLGLTIVKDAIDAHKGKVWAESEEGKYSKFVFTLPK